MNYFKRNISIIKPSNEISFDNYIDGISKGTSVHVLDKSTDELWYKLQWKIGMYPFGYKPLAARQITIVVSDEATNWSIQMQLERFQIYFIIFWNALIILMVSPAIYFNFNWMSVGFILTFLIVTNCYIYFMIRRDLNKWEIFIKNE